MQNIGFNSISVYGKEIEKGTVVDQSQKGTLSINAKQPLEVKYCGEQLTYKQGDLPQTLKNKLKNLKISVVIAEEYSSVAKGGITRVLYPKGKKYAQEGERVTIYVSKERNQNQYPSHRRSRKRHKNRVKINNQIINKRSQIRIRKNPEALKFRNIYRRRI